MSIGIQKSEDLNLYWKGRDKKSEHHISLCWV